MAHITQGWLNELFHESGVDSNDVCGGHRAYIGVKPVDVLDAAEQGDGVIGVLTGVACTEERSISPLGVHEVRGGEVHCD